MSPVTRSPGVQQPDVANESAIRTWLDALASGACDESAFLRLMQERFKSDPEGKWEVLSQLDQYYRRGRIRIEVFQAVKNALAESALGAQNIPSAHVPTPTARETDVAKVAVTAELGEEAPLRREETRSADAVGEIKPGSVLRRRYRIENIVGYGTVGVVFQALDEYRLGTAPGGQHLAIKVLHTAVTKRAELLSELRAEFQQLQLLSHPNILRVFEFDRDGEVVFFTMELLHGSPLSRVLQERKLVPLERPQALAVIREIGAAVAYAHSRAVVHGNINPQNIFITTAGDLRLLNFGAAPRLSRGSATPDHEMTLPSADSSYTSCQVLQGNRADARDDVFALACIAYILLSGEHPFLKKTALEAREAGLRLRRPPQLTNQQWRALRAGLCWEHQGRPADLRGWVEQLDLRAAAKQTSPIADLLSPLPRKKSSLAAAVAAIAALAVLIGGAYWITNDHKISVSVASGPAVQSSAASSPNTAAPVVAAAPREPHSQQAPAVAALPAATPQITPLATPSAATATPAPAAPSAGVPPGRSKIELATDTIEVAPAQTSAQVSVHRKGSLRGETNFTWWTESGTAKPGIDFSAVVPQLASIGDGKSSVALSIPLNNIRRTQSKSFYVVIDQSEGGAALGARRLTMVTLLAPD
jgi:serine/threonine protein kinase